jgi:hypothetical protein
MRERIFKKRNVILAGLLLLGAGVAAFAACGTSPGYGGPGTCFTASACAGANNLETNCTSCFQDQKGVSWKILNGTECVSAKGDCP